MRCIARCLTDRCPHTRGYRLRRLPTKPLVPAQFHRGFRLLRVPPAYWRCCCCGCSMHSSNGG
jgi:hypothetical protein